MDLGILIEDDIDRSALYKVLWEAAQETNVGLKQLEENGVNITSNINPVKNKLGFDVDGNGIDDAFESAGHLHIDVN